MDASFDNLLNDDNDLFEELFSELSGDDPCTTSNNENHADQNKTLDGSNVYKKRRIKKRKMTVDLCDERKVYMARVFQYLSNGDLVSLRRFMNEHYAPNIAYSERFVHYIPNYDLHIEYHDREKVFEHYSVVLQSLPDAIIALHSSKLTVRQDKSSYIVGKMSIRATHLFRMVMTNPVNNLSSFLNRWNPFNYLYGLVAAAKEPELGKVNARKNIAANRELSSNDFDSSSTETTSYAKNVNNNEDLFNLSGQGSDTGIDSTSIATQIKVASPQSQLIVGDRMERPVGLHIEGTFVAYINASHKIYRIDLLKRMLPTALETNPYDASQDDQIFADNEEEFTL